MHSQLKMAFVGTALALVLMVPTVVHAALDSDLNQTGRALVVTVGNQDQSSTGAKSFIESVAKRGIDFLSDPSMGLAQQRQSFRSLLNDSFDLDTIGRFALGKYWRVATPAQRAEYQRLFQGMVVDVYTERFSTYDGQDLKVTGAKMVNDTDALVSSTILQKSGGEKAKVDWRVRKTGNRYRVVDVIVEGVSMGVTQRSDFAAVIQRGGGDVAVLIDHLRNNRTAAKP